MDNVHSFLLFSFCTCTFISMNLSELGGWIMSSDWQSESE